MIYRDQLQAVRKLIEKPEAWTQTWYARREDGSQCDSWSDDAVCWCLLGAASRLRHEAGPYEWSNVEFIGALGVSPSQFNDSHTHAEVLALLDSAIERAPVRES